MLPQTTNNASEIAVEMTEVCVQDDDNLATNNRTRTYTMPTMSGGKSTNSLRVIDLRRSNGGIIVARDKPVDDGPPTPLDVVRETVKDVMSNMTPYIKICAFLLYNLYLGLGIVKTWHKTDSYGEGIKLLVIVTAFAYLVMAYYLFLKKLLVKPIYYSVVDPWLRFVESKQFLDRHLSKIIWAILLVGVVIYAIVITWGDEQRLISGLGILFFVLFGYLMSEHPSKINWSQVLWGLSLQFVMALIVLRSETGRSFFDVIGQKISRFLSFTDDGSKFIFGYLVDGHIRNMNGTEPEVPPLEGVFAFRVLPVILFFSFCVSILYYFGIMQVVVMKAGWVLQVTIGTTACESINAAANIFLGMTEAPLIIKPYVPLMTKSELFAVMTGGFATIAGTVLAAYINFGVNASHLLSASVMAAPGALGVSKLFYPETEVSKTSADNLPIPRGTERNALEAAANGASQAIKICANIAANLIAFMAFITFMDSLCIWLGSVVDMDFLSFKWILGKVFMPVAWMMGVEWTDCDKVGKMIGLKTLVNEFVAYSDLKEQKGQISSRSEAIATYALCGFSNFASIGITLGALGSLVPTRKSDLASIALKSMIAGSTVTFISASMAGLLIEPKV